MMAGTRMRRGVAHQGPLLLRCHGNSTGSVMGSKQKKRMGGPQIGYAHHGLCPESSQECQGTRLVQQCHGRAHRHPHRVPQCCPSPLQWRHLLASSTWKVQLLEHVFLPARLDRRRPRRSCRSICSRARHSCSRGHRHSLRQSACWHFKLGSSRRRRSCRHHPLG